MTCRSKPNLTVAIAAALAVLFLGAVSQSDGGADIEARTTSQSLVR
ncbi:hypothetical protein [Maricaulis sp. CAU 1757]